MRSKTKMVQTNIADLLAQHAPASAPTPDTSLRRTITRQKMVIKALLEMLTLALVEEEQATAHPTNGRLVKKRLYNKRYHAKKKLQKKGGKSK